MPQYIGSIDQGTSSTRFMVFDTAGHIIASHQTEFAQVLPQAGCVVGLAMHECADMQPV